jgi:hypothetical protein
LYLSVRPAGTWVGFPPVRQYSCQPTEAQQFIRARVMTGLSYNSADL